MNSTCGPLLIIGAGPRAQVILDALRADPHAPDVLGFLDLASEDRRVGSKIASLPVLDVLHAISRYKDDIRGAVPAVVCGAAREEIVATLALEGIPVVGVVHPAAVVSEHALLEPGSVVLAGAVISVGARVGAAAAVDCGAIVGPHAHLADFAEVGYGARIGGGARIGERATVEMGANILADVAVGQDARVVAGVTVHRDVEQGVTVVQPGSLPDADLYPEKDLA